MEISTFDLLIYCESKYWKNTQVLLYSNKDVCLKVHVEKLKAYSNILTTMQDRQTKNNYKAFDTFAKLKVLVRILKNQNALKQK